MHTFHAKAAVSAQKVRGGYYTPEAVARFLARWVAEAGGTLLEPSCGDGHILRELVAVANDVQGVELIPEEAEKARTLARVDTSNFFDWFTVADHGQWDGVAGNPPYIRFGNWAEEQRSAALALMSKVGLRPTKLTNAWVPFVIASTLATRDGGRVGLVVPAELLQVTYAAQLREFLLREFSAITLVTFERLVFDGVLQEVVLFLGVKGDGPANMRTVQVPDALALNDVDLDVPAAPALSHDNEKWTKYFLNPEQIVTLRRLKVSGELIPLNRVAEVDVGIVTGRNSFFTLTDEQMRALGLNTYVKPLVSRGNQLSGVLYDSNCRARDLETNLRTWVLDAPEDLTRHAALKAYVLAGERENVHRGYKCSIRKPWWKTPSSWVPDAFMLRQIHHGPRITVNMAGATTTDTVHRMRVRDGVDPLALSVAFHNSATFAFSEILGRSYGGGILELEPREAELLPVPPFSHVTPGLIAEVDMLLKSGEIEKALDVVDRQVLIEGLGLDSALVFTCRDAWMSLRSRRTKRSRGMG